MAALEADFTNRTLLATVLGTRPPVSPEAMVQALGRCGVQRQHVRVEVTFPADFFISFASPEDCARVLERSGHFRCGGASIGFRRWHRSAQATGAKLEFFTKLSFEGLPAEAWEWEAVSQLINKLDGQLVEILPSEDRWCLLATAWMRDPCAIPKEFDFEVPEPEGLPDRPAFSKDTSSLPPPQAPFFRRTLIYPLFIHVLDVIDRSALGTNLLPEYIHDDKDTTRRHVYTCWGGRVDGSGRGPARGGGHAYASPAMEGIGGGRGRHRSSGDWGLKRIRGLLAPAGGIPAPSLHTSQALHLQWPHSPTVVVSPASAEAPSTVTGSEARNLATPLLYQSPPPLVAAQLAQLRHPRTTPRPGSLPSTVAGSAARILTTPSTSHAFLRQATASPTVVDSAIQAPTPKSSPLRPRPLLFSPSSPASSYPPSSPHGGDLVGSVMQKDFSPNQGQLVWRSTEEHTSKVVPSQGNQSGATTPGGQDDFVDNLETNELNTIGSAPTLLNSDSLPTGRSIEETIEARPLQLQGPRSAADSLTDALYCSPLPSILGPRPPASAPRRKKKTIPVDFKPRRSERLRKKDDGQNRGPYHRAQTVLARRMGFAEEEETVTQEAIDEYMLLFSKPLAPQHLRAIAALFAPEGVHFDEPAYTGFQTFSLPEEVEPCT